MVSVVACLVLGLVLLASAVLKLADGAGSRAALATYGITRFSTAVWGALVAVEAALAVAVGAGVDAAAYAAGGLMALFCAAQAAALASGRSGAPCACFGSRGRISQASVARTALLAVALAALPLLPRSEPTTEGWLAIGLAFALAGLVALGVAVLALAREVGMLRLAADPRGALEVPHEGPEVGGRTALSEHLELQPGRIGLAVFSSDACGLCRALAPAVEALGRDPRVALRTFDEVRDAGAWAAADVPGSPFAVALDADGTVLAKGTFNTGAQLESVLAAAERRRGVLNA
ncbi:MAG TPA: MauE/DoxX family redox-associated membrane protein [Solirubrobacteraceae bacterium]|nr:MauE/DoxX family redox-associated membrane protein [Solirubrobacteraceae bacterium]